MPATGDGRAPDATDDVGSAERSQSRRDAQRRSRTTGSAPIPHPRSTPGGSEPVRAAAADFRVLVVEGAGPGHRLFESLAEELGERAELHRVDGVREAAALLPPPPGTGRRGMRHPEFQCVLVDLGAPGELPPGSDGLDELRELLRRAPHTAVVVLTDAAGAELGAAAVAAGAQDFLVRQDTAGPLLARALRYAVERKRADESQRRLVEAEIRGQENARLQRHLLPTPLLDGAGLAFTRRYRPGRRRALLGGDFYDAVRTPDGRVHVVIGDVCGHGPDEAALGVALRIAWRTLVFAGLTGQQLLTTLQHVLEHERRSDEIFATLCMLVLDAPGGDGAAESAELFLAGHPAPLLLGPDAAPVLLPSDQAGPALGLLPCDATQSTWPALRLDLRPGWRLLLYTDGLVEGKVGAGSPRLGQEGLIDLIADHQAAGLTRGRLVDSAIAEVEELNGGALTDDVAVLLLERNPVPVIMG
ncbi:PP2C family protein-serine/threonine phosphatase [Kitasatospora cheerisanensis]|uniref:Putative response regulator n=1 Tax=Kitasatospora cheerisanensis KCTC 2395 TaxID=1348663 RepID=A0A066Z3I3_9ACTN|nr:SpoIIE family protein phosphatase [Kitasatospora cheerisanensis]KDN84690.1 putative response regulator [Kitasatospora cheerisanensis KCTC 2395]